MFDLQLMIPILINKMSLHKFYGIEYDWKLSSVGAISWSRLGDLPYRISTINTTVFFRYGIISKMSTFVVDFQIMISVV